MEKGQIWMIVGVSLVVAIIASIATASITGNAIRVNEVKNGKYQVYTTSETYSKSEINAMFSQLKTNDSTEKYVLRATAFTVDAGINKTTLQSFDGTFSQTVQQNDAVYLGNLGLKVNSIDVHGHKVVLQSISGYSKIVSDIVTYDSNTDKFIVVSAYPKNLSSL